MKEAKFKATFLRNYRKLGGQIVFVYMVIGMTPAQKDDYKAIQGEFYREDEETGNPLYFSTRYTNDNITLIKTRNGRLTVDNSEFDKAASLAASYGGNLGTEIAKQAAAKLLGNSGSASVAPAQVTSNQVATADGIDQ